MSSGSPSPTIEARGLDGHERLRDPLFDNVGQQRLEAGHGGIRIGQVRKIGSFREGSRQAAALSIDKDLDPGQARVFEEAPAGNPQHITHDRGSIGWLVQASADPAALVGQIGRSKGSGDDPAGPPQGPTSESLRPVTASAGNCSSRVRVAEG
jgi:hypothetical protein